LEKKLAVSQARARKVMQILWFTSHGDADIQYSELMQLRRSGP
jgi:hypothetical protein